MSDDISKEELMLIENTKIDNEVLEKVKGKYENIYFKIQLREAISIVQKDLEEDEIIEYHFTGLNYSIETIRMGFAASIMFSGLAHPIFQWNTKCILICTNKRNILVEMTMNFQYSNHYEIIGNIDVVKKKELFYLVFNKEDGETVIQFNMERYNLITEYVRKNSMLTESKKIKIKLPLKVKIVPYMFIALLIFIILIFIITIMREGI